MIPYRLIFHTKLKNENFSAKLHLKCGLQNQLKTSEKSIYTHAHVRELESIKHMRDQRHPSRRWKWIMLSNQSNINHPEPGNNKHTHESDFC